MIKNLVKLLSLFLILFSCSDSNQTIQTVELNFTKYSNGIWGTKVTAKDFVSLLDVAGIQPKVSALEKLGQSEFPIPKDEITAQVVNNKIFLKLPLESEEQIFGLGLNFKSVFRRGKIYSLHMDHYGNSDNGRTHAPIPFYVSSKGYGVLINAAKYIDIYVGTELRKDNPNHPEAIDRNIDPSWPASPPSESIEILIPNDNAEIIVFAGPEPLDAVKRYNLYCGGGTLPPKWGLGFWHRVPTLYSDEQAQKEVEEFRKNGFPLDVLGLEPGWQSKAYPCSYAWDKSRFPQPDKFIADMNEKGVKLNLWINPYISPDSPIYPKLTEYTGSHTVWLGEVPDYFVPEAEIIAKTYFEEELIQKGISGFKIDECDGFDFWLWPDVATFPSGLDGEEMRQVYASKLQKMFSDIYRENNLRTYGLVRGANAGTVGLPFVIYNDYYSHKDFITALINSSFNGVLWTPEVRKSESAEEWLRRMQSVCFSPMAMINAWADGTKPWSFPEVYEEVKEIALLRMRFIPYIYTAFAKYHYEGIPPFLAMNLLPGFSTEKEIIHQYMMGENLLVAPMFTGEKEREVILPEGDWFDFYTGKLVGNNETIIVQPALDKIPLFVKDGGIIPLAPSVLNTEDWGTEIPLEIRYYGNTVGSYKLYDDNGKTFDYEKGEYSWREIKITNDEDGKFITKISSAEKNKPWSYGKLTWRFMTNKN